MEIFAFSGIFEVHWHRYVKISIELNTYTLEKIIKAIDC